MSMFYSSAITNRIYELLDEYETEGPDLYNIAAVDAINNYLHSIDVEHEIYTNDWPNEEGGVCGVAFVDGCHPHLVMFDYKYN